MNNQTLHFGIGNAKLSKSIAHFSLPAGWSCPFAKECYSRSNPLTGKIIDGKHCKFRCFAASNEARATNVRRARWKNFNIMRDSRTVEKMATTIQDALPEGMDKFRVHVSGDFFNERYFLAWLNVAMNNPTKVFYGYTKALPHLVKYRKWIPHNFRFTASKGGTHDHLIGEHGLYFAEVVFSLEEAEAKGLAIDHDDSHALAGHSNFALLLHATQPIGTPAAKAWAKLMRDGIGGYTNEKGFRQQSVKKPFYVKIDLQDGEVVLPKVIAKKGKVLFSPKYNGLRKARA